MNLFIKIIFYFPKIFTIYLIKIRSKKLCRKINHNFKGPYLFKPYGVLDCTLLHDGIKKRLNEKSKAILLKKDKFEINYLKFIERKKCKNGFLDFQMFLWKECKKNNVKNLYYPILDTFIRIIPWQYLFTGFKLKNSFFVDLKKVIKKYEIFYSGFNTLFLPDSAYFNNQLAKQIFMKNKKKVIYLNPNGRIKQYSNIKYSEFSVKKYRNLYKEYSTEIEKYLSDRYMGKSNNDRDTRVSFRSSKIKKKITKKKVLFLHAFRDANNTTWNNNQAFDSYFEWTQYTLKIISQKKDFKNWYIKTHPSGKYYENESEILKKIIKKYNIPLTCFKNCPTTKEILENKLPVYSNSGTIILETATKGYGSYFCNLRLNKKYGFFIASKNDWKKIVNTSYNKVENSKIEKKIQQAAKYTLWNTYKKNIPELCPTIVYRENNVFLLLMQIFKQCFNTIFLKSKNITIPKLQ